MGPKIEAGKKYKTRCGYEARIYCVNAGGDYPVHGAYKIEGHSWLLVRWKADGKAMSTGEDFELDLMLDDIASYRAECRQYREALEDCRVLLADVHLTSTAQKIIERISRGLNYADNE